MGVEENADFLRKISTLVGKKLTVAECYIAYALRDGKYELMSDVPPLRNGGWIPMAKRQPQTGVLCWIVWADAVQHTAYRRTGIGFACADGYVWEPAHGEGESIPDGEVSHWMMLPEGPEV